jgi:hypothetical protein
VFCYTCTQKGEKGDWGTDEGAYNPARPPAPIREERSL